MNIFQRIADWFKHGPRLERELAESLRRREEALLREVEALAQLKAAEAENKRLRTELRRYQEKIELVTDNILVASGHRAVFNPSLDHVPSVEEQSRVPASPARQRSFEAWRQQAEAAEVRAEIQRSLERARQAKAEDDPVMAATMLREGLMDAVSEVQ